MAKAKTNKQPANDPQLKEEVSDAVDEAKQEVSEGNVETATEPVATVDASYQGHSHPTTE